MVRPSGAEALADTAISLAAAARARDALYSRTFNSPSVMNTTGPSVGPR